VAVRVTFEPTTGFELLALTMQEIAGTFDASAQNAVGNPEEP